MRRCNWCSENLGERELGIKDGGVWFHEHCYPVYFGSRGKPLTTVWGHRSYIECE